jgi:hypothetical protein
MVGVEAWHGGGEVALLVGVMLHLWPSSTQSRAVLPQTRLLLQMRGRYVMVRMGRSLTATAQTKHPHTMRSIRKTINDYHTGDSLDKMTPGAPTAPTAARSSSR